MIYQNRTIEPKLTEYLDFFSVVGVVGPRQSGKSSLLQHTLPDYRYVTFDDAVTRNQFYDDPKAFMRIYSDKVIFDEAQKVPEIFDEVKILVDQDRDKTGKFILCGSSQFLLMKKITESLAGRIGLLTLLPFNFNEVTESLKETSIFAGAYPELINKQFRMKEDWFAAYIDTYLTKDVRDFAQIRDLKNFQRLISLLAANTAEELNYSRYANDLDVDVKTIQMWINILEASFIIYCLKPYAANLGKRLTKRPKIYFYDTGLVSFLTGTETQAQYEKGPMSGNIFENYIVMELIKKELSQAGKSDFYYLRTNNGEEIDFIIERRSHLELFEIKKSETFSEKMMKHLKAFTQNGDTGTLIYGGESREYTKPLYVSNYKTYLKN